MRCGAELIRLARGASYRAGARGVGLVLSGAGIVGTEPYRQFTAFHVDENEHADMVARDDTEFVRLALPDLTGLQARRPAQVEAAE